MRRTVWACLRFFCSTRTQSCGLQRLQYHSSSLPTCPDHPKAHPARLHAHVLCKPIPYHSMVLSWWLILMVSLLQECSRQMFDKNTLRTMHRSRAASVTRMQSSPRQLQGLIKSLTSRTTNRPPAFVFRLKARDLLVIAPDMGCQVSTRFTIGPWQLVRASRN